MNFETYDMVPGTEDNEKGMLKIPFSCDQPIKYIDVSYSGKTLNRITFDKDTYAGFIPVPATEQHKGMTIKAKLKVGTVTVTRKDVDDAILHKPENLTATVLKFGDHKVLTDAGAVELKWEVKEPKYNDALSGDEFMVMRSLTGKEEDYIPVGSVTFEEDSTNYTFKDSTLVSALTAEQINGGSVAPHYCVVRATAYQLWGVTDNVASVKKDITLSGLHTLKVNTDYEADWEDEAARTIHVTWNYGNETGAVWDERAKMKLLITSVNRKNEPVDSIYHTLTAEEMIARRKVVKLTRSCVYYNIEFVTELGSSVTHYKATSDSNAPLGLFYYESLGQIEVNSLKTETQQSSVVLTWKKTDDTVDYFRVERRNTTTKEGWEVIAPQVTGLEYEDKTALPVFDYEYRVTSVNDCEGLHETPSDIVAGHCVKTGKVEGYVRFADGSGIPGIRVSVSPYGTGADPTKGGSCLTDESGFYSVDSLAYWGYQKGEYAITVSGIASDDLSEDCKTGL